MASKKQYSGRLIDGRCVSLSISGSTIDEIMQIPSNENLPWLLPPLFDFQHNGALGIAYDNLSSADELYRIREYLLSHGVGRVQATFTTGEYSHLCSSAAVMNDALEHDRTLAAFFYGIFHEGVFISPDAGWRGAHRPDCILPPDWALFQRFDEASGGRVKTINIAPEQAGAFDMIDRAIAAGKKISLGHCHPGTDTIRKAVEHGATLVTHFGNGSALMIPRLQNPLWEYLNNSGLKLGVIGDGFHLPPEVVSVVRKQKGKHGFFMVSDASSLSGCAPGVYKSIQGGLTCVMEENGFLHLENEMILAGASCQQDSCVEFLVRELGLPFAEAWAQCSTIPAEIAGISLPEIEAEAEATFVIADWKDNKLHLHETLFYGESCRRETRAAV